MNEGKKKEPCLMCGATPEKDFNGLCTKCCKLLKAKNDAWARRAERELAEAKADEERRKLLNVRIIYHDANELII